MPTRRQADGSVRVWGETGVTVNVTESPPQFIRITIGHERIAPNDDEATITRYEKLVYDFNEKAIEKRIKELVRVFNRAEGEGRSQGSDTVRSRARSSAKNTQSRVRRAARR